LIDTDSNRLCRRTGFTLVELLVVVAIVVVLIALLAPALDKAVDEATKTVCLANQRSITQSLRTYCGENKSVMPIWSYPGCSGSAYDLRDAAGYYTEPAHDQEPAGMGLLITTGLLPIGKAFHCPCIDNMGSELPGVGMDIVVNGDIVGASHWAQYPTRRVIGSYNYRAVSFLLTGKGLLKASDASSRLVLTIDLPDTRFGGIYLHPEGYNRTFGDGHGGFWPDPNRDLFAWIEAYTGGLGYFDGTYYPVQEERLYDEEIAADR
jgi:prepilin-type N-terminal cleavage/methylation domain-containing protein